MPRTILEGWLCYRCKHKWVPRDEETPRVCPKCKSPYWDKRKRTDIQNEEIEKFLDVVTTDNGFFIPSKQVELEYTPEEFVKVLKLIVNKNGKPKK